jgi:hypothetical protein
VDPASPAANAQPAAAKNAAPIPIIDQASRKQAFAALLSDELAGAGAKVKAATSATSLPPVVEAARLLGDLRALELASGAEGGQVKQMGATIGGQAHKLIANAMNGMDRRVEEVWDSASRTRVRTNRAGFVERAYGLQGMTSVEANDLKGIIATLEKVVPVARDLAAVTGGAELTDDAREAVRLYDRAQQVLTFDYANEGRNTSQSQGQTLPQTQIPNQVQPRSGQQSGTSGSGTGSRDPNRATGAPPAPGNTQDISRP